MAQEATQSAPEMSNSEKTAVLKEFTRNAYISGVQFSFVLLNNKSVEAIFAGASKNAMREKANASTVFFVQGKAASDVTQFNPRFTVEQNGKSIVTESVNINNFQAGTLSKGAKVAGLIQVSEKVDVTQPFKIIGQQTSVEFKLSKNALKYLQN